jgi:diguanylate cyclase (GGDEF)-like protein
VQHVGAAPTRHECGRRQGAADGGGAAIGPVRGTDAVYRIGGDEFVIVADAMSQERPSELASHIGSSVRAPVSIADSGVTVSVSCSVGTAVLSPDVTDAYAVLEEADQAMYAAKTARSTGAPTMAALSP